LILTGNITGKKPYITGTEITIATSIGKTFGNIQHVTSIDPLQVISIPMIIKIAKVLISITKIPAKVSAISFSSAGLPRTQARRQRKLKEWQYRSISLQLKLASSRRRGVVLRESNNHQRQMEHSQEVLDFMQDKFSKHSPNLFLQQETSAILERMFELCFVYGT
jgi:hypothetical protein